LLLFYSYFLTFFSTVLQAENQMVLGILRVTWLNVSLRYYHYLSYSKESKELGLSLQVGIQEQ
jgi:hypothetical protein